MNPIKVKIVDILNDLPIEFKPLKEQSLKYTQYCSIIDIDDKIQIGHRPWVAPYNFAITLFPPAKKAWVSKFKKKHGISIPLIYQKFLLTLNGCFCYGISLFGLMPSMQESIPLIDRSKLQCHDLSLANKYWINSYDIGKSSFYFGSRAYSFDENVGYFIFGDNSINTIRENGEIISTYISFDDFLEKELCIAESMMKEESPIDWWD